MTPVALAFLAVSMTLGSPATGQLNEGARELNRGDVAKGLALTRQALDSLNLTVRGTAAGLNNMCVGFLRLRLYEEALEHCDRAIEIDGHNWRFLNNRGNAYFGMGKIDEAIEDYLSALKINPRSDLVRDNLFIAFEYKILGATHHPSRSDKKI